MDWVAGIAYVTLVHKVQGTIYIYIYCYYNAAFDLVFF